MTPEEAIKIRDEAIKTSKDIGIFKTAIDLALYGEQKVINGGISFTAFAHFEDDSYKISYWKYESTNITRVEVSAAAGVIYDATRSNESKTSMYEPDAVIAFRSGEWTTRLAAFLTELEANQIVKNFLPI